MNNIPDVKTTTFKTVKTKTLATIMAIILAVALPQIFHAVGAVLGMGTLLGQYFLPMHLPILLLGLLAGPIAGLTAGLISPLISFALSGMPLAAVLPFMIIELAFYGVSAGLLTRRNMPVIVKVLLAQLAGRAARWIAVLIAVYGLGSQSVPVASVWANITAGYPGLILQWVVIPLVMFWTQRNHKNLSDV